MIATPVQTSAVSLRQRLRKLYPLDNGPQEIRAMDGLRATAALFVVVYHSLVGAQTHLVLQGQSVDFLWFYMESGVDLFFVLSGFLLFLPYARAMLDARPLPSIRQFYRRRALRILPAYWFCLAALVLLDIHSYVSRAGVKNVLTHIVLLHDDFPVFNRTIEGPFWTLAVEAQFYVVLPLFALLIARFVGSSRSVVRLLGGVLAVIVLALATREGVAIIGARLHFVHGTLASVGEGAILAINGTQGKYLEVFGVGMLCSVLYVVVRERQLVSQSTMWRLGAGLVGVAVVAYVVLAQQVIIRHNEMLAPCYLCMSPRDPEEIAGPFMIGLGYGALVLGVLWSGRLLRAPFELGWLRFVGFISYSLYLWHQPIIFAVAPFMSAWPMGLRILGCLGVAVFVALPFSYLSYQFIERPFLQRRRRESAAGAAHARDSQAEIQPSLTRTP